MGCKIKSLVYYEHYPGEYVLQHSHKCYEAVFYMNGAGVITVDNEMHHYTGPTFTIVSPQLKHDEKTEEFTKVFIILFELDEEVDLLPFIFYPIDANHLDEWNRKFELLQQEEREKKLYYSHTMSAIFTTIFLEVLRETYSSKNKIDNREIVLRMKNYIKENYKQDINFALIASTFGYSYDRFRHIFVEVTGTPINQYLMNCRLYAAKQLLLNTDLTIKEIAFECGFKSDITFHSFFRKRMNISPLQFRKSSQHEINVGVILIQEKKKNEKISLD